MNLEDQSAPSVWLLTTTDLSNGVGVTQVLDLARELERNQIPCCVVTPDAGFKPRASKGSFWIGQLRFLRQARRLYKDRKIPDVIIARSFQSLPASLIIAASMKAKLVYDLRGLWTYTKSEELNLSVGWFLRFFERLICRNVDGYISLTHLGQSVAANSIFPRHSSPPSIVVPTLTDFRLFRGPQVSPRQPEADAGPITIGLIGSINRDYLTSIALKIYQKSRLANPLVSLVVSVPSPSQQHLFECQFSDLLDDRIKVVSTPSSKVPELIDSVDVCLMIMRESPSKAGSMPTRLAEYFASGTPIVFFGCNSEVKNWVEKYPLGYVLTELSSNALEDAASWIVRKSYDLVDRKREHDLQAFWMDAKRYFSLEFGAAKYASFIRSIAPTSKSPGR